MSIFNNDEDINYYEVNPPLFPGFQADFIISFDLEFPRKPPLAYFWQEYVAVVNAEKLILIKCSAPYNVSFLFFISVNKSKDEATRSTHNQTEKQWHFLNTTTTTMITTTTTTDGI